MTDKSLNGLALLFVHPDYDVLTNLGNRIVGYSFVSKPRPIKWNAFGRWARLNKPRLCSLWCVPANSI